MKIEKKVLVEKRVRRIDKGFCFIPHTFLQKGFFSSLEQSELLLYFLLILVSDRNGLSYYSYDKLCSLLRMSLETYIDARNGLIDKDLIAFDGFMFQVLSLPRKAKIEKNNLKTEQDFLKYDQASVQQVITKSLNG